MAEENTEWALTIYKPNLPGQLAAISGEEPFQWNSGEREKEAREYFEAAILAAKMGIQGQSRLQLKEVLKLTFVDFLKRHRANVTFGYASLPTAYPLNTAEVLMDPATFRLIEILEVYSCPRVFGERGLNLNSLRISEKKGCCMLQVGFLDEVCIVSY